MTLYVFDDTIPATNNSPSEDQPNMKINNQSTNGILSTDHITFNNDYGGTHTQQTYTTFSTVPLPPASIGTEASVAYPDAGTANSTNASYYFDNYNSSYLLNCIKAFGSFTEAGSPTFLTQYNCSSIVNVGGQYNITLNANVVTGNNVCVLVSTTKILNTLNYAFSAGVLSILPSNSAGTIVSFVILQA